MLVNESKLSFRWISILIDTCINDIILMNPFR